MNKTVVNHLEYYTIENIYNLSERQRTELIDGKL